VNGPIRRVEKQIAKRSGTERDIAIRHDPAPLAKQVGCLVKPPEWVHGGLKVANVSGNRRARGGRRPAEARPC